MGSNSDVSISAILDKIMEDEEKKSKKKQKDVESKKKENHGNIIEQIKVMPPHYGPPMVGNFPAFPNHNEMHLKQAHPMTVNINPPHPLPPNGSVPPQFHHNFSQPPPPMPFHNEMPMLNAGVIGVNNSHPPNILVPPPCEYFPPPPPTNHNPQIYGSGHPNLMPNVQYQNFQTFPEPNANLSFPIEPSNPSIFSSPYNNRISNIENDNYDHKRKKVKTNSLPHSSIAVTLPPPPSPPKLDTYNNSKGVSSSYDVNSPKRPYTPPNCPTPELTQKPDFHSETKRSKISRSPKRSDVGKLTRHTSKKSSEPPSKSYERKNYEEKKSSSYDKRDRREKSYGRRNNSEKDYKQRKYNSESSYRHEKYGHSKDQKRSRSREADHRSVNKYKHRKTFNEPVPKEAPPFSPNIPQPHFNSFNECMPFNPIVPGFFNPVKQETLFPVVEGMPFPPPGLNFTPVKKDPHFNSDLRPFDPPPPLKAPLFTPMQRPPFNGMQEGPLNIPIQSPYNHLNDPQFIPIESQPFNDNFKQMGKENDYSHPKVDLAPKSSKSSRSHKNNKRKRKHHTDPKENIESEDENGKRLKHKHKKEKKKKGKRSGNSKDNYELEPGECVSDSFSDDDFTSSFDDSESEDSSSSSSDTEDSLYKLDFLKHKKPITTRFDESDKEVTNETTVVKSAEKPKFPRYFKDRVAYCNDASVTNLDEPALELPVTEKSETSLTKIEEPKTPCSPSLVSESLKAIKTPLIRRLGLAQNGEAFTKDDNDYDTVIDEPDLRLHTEQENFEDHQLASVNENSANACVSGDISPFTFEQYMQRSSSLSPNNSLDFEEYKLLVSTKEILSASKSIFKSPTSPKSTTTKKKYEKPIIKVETASKPTHLKEIKESPQRIDLDSRIRLMFGMKSSCDNSPEKKNFRNAAFSYKSMHLLPRPPSPFRNRSAYQFWHRETYYFRKNNPIPDIFSDPTQTRKFGAQSLGSKAKIARFLNLKEDYYQSREITPDQSTKSNKHKNTKEKEEEEEANVDKSSTNIGEDHKLNIECSNNDNQEEQEAIKDKNEKEEKTLESIKYNRHSTITKINVSPDCELELVSENYEDKIELNKLETVNETYNSDSDNIVKIVLSQILVELKNEIRSKLTEEIIDETFKISDKDKQGVKFTSTESHVDKKTIERNEEERGYQKDLDLKENHLQEDSLIHGKRHKKS